MKHRTSLQRHSREIKLVVFVLALPWLASVDPNERAQDASASQGQPAQHVFTPGYTAKALPTGRAVSASIHTFKAEDGTPVYQSDDWYKSADDAGSALDRLTKRASRVIKRGTKQDAKRGVIGRRVELVFNRRHKASPEMVIAWTDGATVVRLSSASLPLLLDFESQYYP